jgi:hypothetical protein
MTDHPPDGTTGDRAEQAFRTALASRAETFPPAVLDVPAPRRPRRWPLLVASAAAVILVVGLVAVVGGHRDEAAPSHVLPGGWRWESYANVMVAVPDSWGYAPAPGGSWCASRSPVRRAGPGYVDSRSPFGGEVAIGCGGTPPVGLTRPHLSFLETRSELPVPLGWKRDFRTVAGTRVTVTIDDNHEELAERILATAHVVRRDQNGCTPSSPLQDPLAGRPAPAFDVSTLDDVDSIAVCQYGLGDPRAQLAPGLIASQLLTGERADAELAALQAASTVGGPNRAHSCGADERGDTGIALLLNTGETTHEMYAIYESCSANGIDDGTNVRELTRGNCRPLFDARIQIVTGINTAFDRCEPPKD